MSVDDVVADPAGATTSRWRQIFVATVLVHLIVLYSPRSVSVPEAILGWDKLVHMAVFGVVLYVGARAGYSLRLLVPLLVLNAVLSELAQHYWLAKRAGDPYDTIADLVGVLAAYLLLRHGDRDRG